MVALTASCANAPDTAALANGATPEGTPTESIVGALAAPSGPIAAEVSA
jgi:hypothetical protein